MAKKFSVVIVSYNCWTELETCIQSIISCSGPETEIIVVDNNSQDNTADMLSHDARIRPILNSENLGFSKACNIGAAAAQGEFLVFLNPDTVVTPHWLERMAAHLSQENIGAVGPLSDYVAGLQKYQIHYQSASPQSLGLADFAADISRRNSRKGILTKLLIGFCLMTKKELFVRLGGMDENLFLGNDDLDLSWRLGLQGMRLVVAADVFIHHAGQKSFSTEPGEKTSRLVQESTDALYRKLVKYYGGPDKVPPSEVLWGMNWFKPSRQALEGVRRTAQTAAKEQQVQATYLIYAPPDENSEAALARTLKSIPEPENQEIIIINHSSRILKTTFPHKTEMLDISTGQTVPNAVETGLRLAQKDYCILCMSGVEFSEFFNLSWRQNATDCTPVKAVTEYLPEQRGNSENPIVSAIIARKNWTLSRLHNSQSGSLLEFFQELPATAPSDLPILRFSRAFSEKRPESRRNSTASSVQSDESGFLFRDESSIFTSSGQKAGPENMTHLNIPLGPGHLSNLGSLLSRLKKKSPRLRSADILYLHAIPLHTLPGKPQGSLLADNQRIREAAWNAGFFAEPSLHIESPFSPEIQTLLESAAGLHQGQGKHFLRIPCYPRNQNPVLDKLVSIIILGFNQVEYTKKCIESIQSCTRQKYELILVDNGSSDNTRAYFHSVAEAVVIDNDSNLGVAKGWNQGMKIARGDYLLIFNNDTIVSAGWLENMVRLAESGSRVGIVGPRTNNISGPQLIPGLKLQTEIEIKAFSRKWMSEHDMEAFELERIAGFCMLISREAFDSVGYFDERFGKGNFEDDDWCLRSIHAGFKSLVANDSFIFHFGSVSFSDGSVDWRGTMFENARKFIDKWKSTDSAVTDKYIASFQPLVLQLLQEAAVAYGRQDMPHAEKCYSEVLKLDNENAAAHNGMGIIHFHKGQHDDAFACFKTALKLNPRDEDTAVNIMDVLEKTCTSNNTLKCINSLIIEFPSNPVLLKELEKRAGAAGESLAHWKSHVEMLISGKRYTEALTILEGILRSGNELAFCYNYLGIIAFECGDAQMAWDHFKKSLDLNLLDEDVLINYCDAGITLGHRSEVLNTLEKVFTYPSKSPRFNEVMQYYGQLKLEDTRGNWNADRIIHTRELNIAGENLIREGMFDKAAEVFQDILKQDPGNFRALNNLGLLAWYGGNYNSAWDLFSRSLDINPQYSDALINAFDAALRIKKIDILKTYIEHYLEKDSDNPEILQIYKTIRERGDAVYEIRSFESIDHHHSLLSEADGLLASGNLDEASIQYLDALEKKPDSWAAYNGLGIIAYKRKMYREAFRLFETAAELNPLDQDTLLNLWDAAGILDRQGDVIGRLSSALQVDPGLEDVRKVVDKHSG